MKSLMKSRQNTRGGLTLIEMLVSVALLVLLMMILVTIFASASGSLQEQQAFNALDMEQRRIEATLRGDLRGSTARMTPPNNPVEGNGYFEYAENALADAQGEDSDDTLRFTVQVPEDGKPFVGRMWVPRTVPPTDPGYLTSRARTLQPIMVTSRQAEVIYFLRNGNLYRRVLLLKPELGALGTGNLPTDPDIPPDGQPPFVPPIRRDIPNSPQSPRLGFQSDMFRPTAAFQPLIVTIDGISLPVVGWAAMNDVSAVPSDYPREATSLGVPPNQLPVWGPDGYGPKTNTLSMLTDRHNRAFNPRFANDYLNDAATLSSGSPVYEPDGIPDDINGNGVPDFYPTQYPNAVATPGFYNDPGSTARSAPAIANSAVDVFAFPYVFPQAYSRPDPFTAGFGWVHSLNPDPNYDTRATTFLNPPYNHNPIDIGDSLPLPTASETWWGFPTWRETASPFWLGNLRRLNDPPGSRYFNAQADGTISATESAPTGFGQSALLSWQKRATLGMLLPPQFGQANSDQSGNPLFFNMPPNAVWEEDLLATNVRSFDVKAYDPNAAVVINGNIIRLPSDYYDLGYANLWGPGAQGLPAGVATPPLLLSSFAHEGRMPPLSSDFRFDPNYPSLSLGDDNPNVVRLRRVWDSWSTTYSNAPDLPVDPVLGPLNGLPPVYRSYPAPYPAPLRGIQIKIRMTDPGGKRVKNLTIKHDFTNKL